VFKFKTHKYFNSRKYLLYLFTTTSSNSSLFFVLCT